MYIRFLLVAALCHFLLTQSLASHPPSIVVGPSDRIVVAGGKVSLDCLVDGDPTPSVAWRKDNSTINVASDDRFDLLANGTLRMKNFRTEDQGVYFCTAGNRIGRLRSANAAVLESSYFQLMENTVRHRSEILTLSQTAEVDPSDREATWTIRSIEPQTDKRLICPSPNCPGSSYLSPTDRFKVQAVLRLAYSQLLKEFPSSKQFLVEARVGKLETKFASANFDGLAWRGLTIDLAPDTITVEARKEATLYCISNGPGSVYHWFKDDKPIDVAKDSKYNLVIDGILKISNVNSSDVGIYKCQVEGIGNFSGIRETEAIVDVFYPPEVQVRKRLILGNEDVIGIECAASGTAPFAVELSCDGSILSQEPIDRDDIQAKYTSARFEVKRNAMCGCLIFGSFGSVSATQYVNVTEDIRLLKLRMPSSPPERSTGIAPSDSLNPESAEATTSVPIELEESGERQTGLSGGAFIGLLVAVIVLAVIVLILVVFISLRTKSDKKDQTETDGRKAGLSAEDIGNPVPTDAYLRKKGIAPAASRASTPDSLNASRNDLSGTKDGGDLVLFNAVKQSTEGSRAPPPPPPPKPKPFKPVSVTDEGYAVVESDCRQEAAPAPRGGVVLRSGGKPVVDSGEYAQLDPLPPPPPPLPSSATRMSSVTSCSMPSGLEDDWHFLLNGREYAVADVNAKRSDSSTPVPPKHDAGLEYASTDLAEKRGRESPVAYATVMPGT